LRIDQIDLFFLSTNQCISTVTSDRGDWVKKAYGLVVDWETSGLRQHESPWRTYLEGPQGIEIGAVLVELPDFTPIAEYVSRVRFLGTAHGIQYGGPHTELLTWSDEAETIHGISLNDLMGAPTPTQVADELVRFVLGHAGIDDAQKQPIMICGHNPAGDAYCVRQLLFLGLAESKLRFHHRMLDSFSLGYMLLGTKSSNELFKRVSDVVRGTHNALEDARLTLAAFQLMRTMTKELTNTPLQ
jgi:DNA polymerase III epsilon subunit-like protein